MRFTGSYAEDEPKIALDFYILKTGQFMGRFMYWLESQNGLPRAKIGPNRDFASKLGFLTFSCLTSHDCTATKAGPDSYILLKTAWDIYNITYIMPGITEWIVGKTFHISAWVWKMGSLSCLLPDRIDRTDPRADRATSFPGPFRVWWRKGPGNEVADRDLSKISIMFWKPEWLRLCTAPLRNVLNSVTTWPGGD